MSGNERWEKYDTENIYRAIIIIIIIRVTFPTDNIHLTNIHQNNKMFQKMDLVYLRIRIHLNEEWKEQ